MRVSEFSLGFENLGIKQEVTKNVSSDPGDGTDSKHIDVDSKDAPGKFQFLIKSQAVVTANIFVMFGTLKLRWHQICFWNKFALVCDFGHQRIMLRL